MFLLRNPDFLETVPENQKKVFVDGNPIAPSKLSFLKKMIEDRFPVSFDLIGNVSNIHTNYFLEQPLCIF